MSHRTDPRPLKMGERDLIEDGWFFHENGGLRVYLAVRGETTVLARIPASELREWAREDAARTAKRKARKERER